ncbi:hypothetical protein ACF3OE_12405 [Capnocytophaga canis]|uniref:hypothetical protein n=1 Tax=Capnocytophaga canis TaxID=1848903 RepID=UPI00370D8F53
MIITATLKSTGQKVSAELKEIEYVRLLLWGGARNSGDNSAFYYASLNVKKDYGSDGKIIHQSVDTAKKVVDLINEQADNSIQSLDIFCHGSQVGLYFIKGASIYKNITEKERDEKNLNSPLAIGSFNNFLNSNLSGDERLISDINYNKFTNSAKIEIHGCSTADSVNWLPWTDNICEDLSENLYDAGKSNSVVIGHTTKANPNLPTTVKGEKEADKDWEKRKIIEQDYRHGERRVYNNGEVILTTKKQGRITGKEIKDAFNRK